MNRVFVFLGPTGSGKTELLFRYLNTKEIHVEVISVDSRQVYKYIPVGTAVPEKKVRDKIPHHLVEILEPDAYFSAGEFVKRAEDAIETVRKKNRIPLLCGGTGFYFKALRTGMFVINEEKENKQHIRDYLSRFSDEEKRELLRKIDPESFAMNAKEIHSGKIHQNDRYRIQRSLELYFLTGKTLRQHYLEKQQEEKKWIFEGIIYFPEKESWHRKLEERVRDMVARGFLEECVNLFEKYPESPAINSPGYKEVYEFYKIYRRDILSKKYLDEIVKAVIISHKRYGKRQITWFRQEKSLRHADLEATQRYLMELELNLQK